MPVCMHAAYPQHTRRARAHASLAQRVPTRRGRDAPELLLRRRRAGGSDGGASSPAAAIVAGGNSPSAHAAPAPRPRRAARAPRAAGLPLPQLRAGLLDYFGKKLFRFGDIGAIVEQTSGVELTKLLEAPR